MKTEQEIIEAIKKQAMMPLFYHDDADTCVKATEALYRAGIRCFEFTNRGPQAIENFKALVKQRDISMPGLLLGIGTIKTAHEAQVFLDAGADFLVSPVFDRGVCDVAYLNKVLWIPGCTTPTEIHVAGTAGCYTIKLFPGNLLGPAFVKAIMPLFSGYTFMVTGGVDASEQNLRSWFESGVTVVGMGSNLVSANLLNEKAFDTIETNTRAVLETIAAIKK